MNFLAATITGSQLHYDILTDNIIYHHLYTLKTHHLNPTHLFLTESGSQELTQMSIQGIKDPPKDATIKMFLGMHVVVLPGLPGNTLLMGTLQLYDR